MAYNPYFSNPNYYPQYAQNQYSSAQQSVQQIQNGGFVPVRGEQEARNYPVAIGTSITFKDETAPYVYTKTMGFSQLDTPIFERYRLVKEQPQEQVQEAMPTQNLQEQIAKLWDEIDALKDFQRNMQEESKRERKQRSKHDADVSADEAEPRRNVTQSI